MEIKKFLNEDEAHEEANMMRIKAGADPGSKEFLKEFQGPKTKEEYDKALAVVEEIKQMVGKKEPMTQKVFSEISRLAIQSGYGVLMVIAELTRAKAEGKTADEIYQKKNDMLRKIDSASAKLKELQAQANDLGEFDSMHEEVFKDEVEK